MSSIRVKKELQLANKSLVKEEEAHLPAAPFNENDMLVHWNKYAQKLSDKGHLIMESLLINNTPKLNGTVVSLELSSEGSKIDFETEINGLLKHLKSHLQNHEITIEIVVNESIANKKAFSPQERFNRLNEINPNLELLRRTFDLDF